MSRLRAFLIGSCTVLVGACSASGLGPFSPGQTPVEPGALAVPSAAPETSLVVPGAPTEVYTQVARGIMACWLGASGPLKQSHIFHADAQSAATGGGGAEIVLQERDTTLRDQRGVRAFRVQMSPVPGGSLVAAASLKMDPRRANAMMKDITVWAKGGSGCELGTRFPPPAVAKPSMAKKAKAKSRR